MEEGSEMIGFFVELELDSRHVSKREAATLKGVLKLICVTGVWGQLSKLGSANEK